LYLLHHYDENHQTLPIIDKKLVNTVMKVMCGVNEEKRGRPPNKDTVELKDKLISNTSVKTSHLKPMESDGEFS
jgi:hypothetical protein